MLPNIRDDAVDAMLGLTQGNQSYADYTQMFNDFLRRSRQPLTNDLKCVKFISGLLILNYRLMPSPIDHYKGAILNPCWSYTIF
jgi:hypothetical protein